jgi:hypothetical protein
MKLLWFIMLKVKMCTSTENIDSLFLNTFGKSKTLLSRVVYIVLKHLKKYIII